MWANDTWEDYTLLDASSGERLERWGEYILIRPDPQVLWHTKRENPLWRKADAIYKRSRSGGGSWTVCNIPDTWNISYGPLTFQLRPMGFKHTGLFPEQAVNWDWFSHIIRRAVAAGRRPTVLNLFAYTGGATAAAAAAGASVCHVDAARGMVQAAKENLRLSGLGEAPVRYIVDDCKKFVEREIRRGRKYDGIIMDPPSYGRGPGGEVWKLEDCAGRAHFSCGVPDDRGTPVFLGQLLHNWVVSGHHGIYGDAGDEKQGADGNRRTGAAGQGNGTFASGRSQRPVDAR